VDLDRQVSKEPLDFGSRHLGWVLLVVEQNEAPKPLQIGSLGAETIVFRPNPFAYSVE
jgi:hypothetical protein